ncbi:MAG: CRISPR-associated helicase Cas3' [Ardenticatenaceae bacterium]|nr:CRISPR-associated helicase Cas3' [Ardenticatenaceae bacterium]
MSRSGKKANRLLQIEALLLAHPEGLTQADIARKLQVNRSTVGRYFVDLPGHIYLDDLDGNKWKVDREGYLVNVRFNLHEALAIHLATRLLATRMDKQNPHAAAALRKLGVSLERLAARISAHIKQSADVMDDAARRHDPLYMQVLEKLTRAWAEGRKVEVWHRHEPTGSVHKYKFAPYFVEPYAIGQTTHVIGWREPPGAMRTFKIERIERIELLAESYTIPADFNLRQFLTDAWGIWYTEEEPQKVVLRFSRSVANRVRESRWHESEQLVEEVDGRLLWQAQVAEPQEMLPWIRGWGADVEVVGPESLRRTLEREARRLAELYGVRAVEKQLVAHVRDRDKKIQSLEEHLSAVSNYAGRFASKIGLAEIGKIIGLLHDVGKASDEFQNYIRSGTGLIPEDSPDWVDVRAKKGKVDHSTAGAQIIYQKLSERGDKATATALAIALCIASHHSGLIDSLKPDGENNFQRRIEKPEEGSHANEAWANLTKIANKLDELLSNDIEARFIEKLDGLKVMPESPNTINFKRGLLVRYLLSCLIDADRLDTADFEFPSYERIRNYGNYTPWETLIDRLQQKIGELENKPDRNDVDDLRSRVSQACLEFAAHRKGIYQLTVPTGGGKTLASLRFGLNHAQQHKLDRIFYIIPYTSIIDQNADEVRKILEEKDKNGHYLNKVVLEHHSNIIPDDEDEEKNWIAAKRRNLLSDNWDAPIVFTTQVQFLETLFGSGTKSVRRMHQLANSVIIFDEVQTIPVCTVHMFNAALEFLVQGCGSTVVLCTATQPLLDKIDPPQHALKVDGKIIEHERELFEQLKRVEVFDKRKIGPGWTDEEVAELAKQELDAKGSVLIVVNTKNSASSLYQTVAANNPAEMVYHLSTKMCPAHRLEKLNEIRAKLNSEEPVICVSTQLIEAGVDIDFGSVIRYLAGLDSITQAAGRCNRSGKQKDENGNKVLGNVFIVNRADESIDRLKDIKEGIKVTERILGEFDSNPERFGGGRLGLDAMKQYYEYYFYRRKLEMAYTVGPDSLVEQEDNLFNLLSRNTTGTKRNTSAMGAKATFIFKQAFQTASKEFEVIASHTRGVIVPYGEEGREIINELCSNIELEKQYRLIKKAQRYSVNLFPHEFKKLVDLDAIREVQAGAEIFYLDAQYYSEEFGWSNDIVNQMDTLIC